MSMVLFEQKGIILLANEQYVGEMVAFEVGGSKSITRRYCTAEFCLSDTLGARKLSDLFTLKAHTERFKYLFMKRRTSSGRIHEDHTFRTEIFVGKMSLLLDICYESNVPRMRFSARYRGGTEYLESRSLDILSVMALDNALQKAIGAFSIAVASNSSFL